MLILPYRKGERPDTFAVEKQGAQTIIRNGDMTLTLGDNCCVCIRGARKSLTTYDAQPAEAHGMRIAGGPAEIILDKTGGTLTLSGAPGPRGPVEQPKPSRERWSGRHHRRGWGLQAEGAKVRRW
jgi:hypothetical protein